jgi:hypothetical protein
VIIHLRPRRLAALLDDRLTAAGSGAVADEPTLPLTHPVQLRRAGKEVRMVIDHTDPFAPAAKPDPSLVKVIAKANRFNESLLRGGAAKFADLAKSEKLNRSYYSQILRLAYLAPDITTAILEGRQPSGLTATMLIERPTCRWSPWPTRSGRAAACDAAPTLGRVAACTRIFPKWGIGILNQSRNWAVESTWSSSLPLGKVVISCRYSASHGAVSGR